MKAPQKFFLSMLIAVLTFGAFTLWAYTGLFASIETNFFRQRIEDSVIRQIADTEGVFVATVQKTQKELETFFSQDFVVSIFRVNQSASDTQVRSQELDRLKQQQPVVSVRIFDLSGQLHESTRISDIKEQTPNRKEFLPSSQLQSELPLEKLLLPEGTNSTFFLDPVGNQFIFSIPILSVEKVRYGTAVVTLTTQNLSRINERWARTSFGDRFRFLDSRHVVINMPAEEPSGLFASLGTVTTQLTNDNRFRVEASGGRSWFVYPLKSSLQDFTMLFLVDSRELEFPWYLRIVLLSIVFLTVFLIAFLILNLKQDEMVVLSDRIKRLQINILRQYLERKDELDAGKWQSELKVRREEVKATIKKGLGHRNRKSPEVDELIDKGWDEILEVLGARKPAGSVMGTMDLSRLEDLVQKVISNYQHQIVQLPVQRGTVSAGAKLEPMARIAAPATTKPKPALPYDSNPEEVEELVEEAEAIEEVEELVEEAEAVEEVEELVEEAEAVEEVEELAEEAEAVEEVEELVEEAEAIEEVEELVEEAEAVEEVEELIEEAEAVEEVEELSEEAEAVEEVEELVEEAQAVEEVEESEGVMIPFYDESIPSVVSYDLEGLHDDEDSDDLANGDAPAVVEEVSELYEILDAGDAQAIEELKPRKSRSGISFFGSYTPVGNSRAKVPVGANSILGKAQSLEEAGTLEELRLKCGKKLTLKSVYDYTGKPESALWNFDTTEGGVVKIPHDVFARRKIDKLDQNLDSLVNSVIKEVQTGGEVRRQPGTSIEGLLRFDSTVESIDHSSDGYGQGSTNAVPQELAQEQRSFYKAALGKTQSLIVTASGLDFDSFAKDFRSDEGGKIKAMYTFSKRFRAETAMIVRIEMGGLRVQRILGMAADCGPWVSYLEGGECLMELNAHPSIAHFASSETVLKLVKNPCSDFSLAKRQVWVPLRYEERLSYCIFGYTHEIEMATFLSDYMAALPVKKVV